MAVFTHVISDDVDDWDRWFLGRAPRTRETLPDFRESCRVSRHSRVFRGLTGSQRTPGNGASHYRVMPFGLKNAGATNQRLVNKMFQKQIGTSMEVYIDDMLVKSTMAEVHITHLAEAFHILKKYNMKLNPAK